MYIYYRCWYCTRFKPDPDRGKYKIPALANCETQWYVCEDCAKLPTKEEYEKKLDK